MFLDVSIRFPNLGITLNDLLMGITIFGFEIAFYGIIIAIGAMAGMALGFREAKKTGQNVEHYVDLALFGLIFAIIGARLYYVIFKWDYYSKHLTEIFAIRDGGLAIYGGVIVAIIVAFIVAKIHKINFFLMADTGCIGLILGQIIGRWGNFFNREAFGGYSDGLFAMQINIDDGIVDIAVPDALKDTIMHLPEGDFIQVQPTFLYESAWNLAVLIFIMIFKKYKRFNGEVFAWYIGGYGIGRFIIESFRTDSLYIPGTSIRASQVVAIVMVVAAVAICLVMRIKTAKTVVVAEPQTDVEVEVPETEPQTDVEVNVQETEAQPDAEVEVPETESKPDAETNTQEQAALETEASKQESMENEKSEITE